MTTYSESFLNKLFSYSIWLLGYEFSDTIVLLTREKAIFAVSSKKSKCKPNQFFENNQLLCSESLLEAMKTPEDYDGPAI